MAYPAPSLYAVPCTAPAAVRARRRPRNWVKVVSLALVASLAAPAVTVSTARVSPYPHPTLDDAAEITETLETELRWLLMSIHPSGAIALGPDRQHVIPYFSNLAAAALVDRVPTAAGMYIDWYLSNLNMPDRWGLYGTIYDFKVHGADLVPTRNYDSADSYAATFLTLVRKYVEATGDLDFAGRRRKALETIAGVLLSLQDRDGLVRVKPRDSTKYLMDNAEAFRGLEDWASVLDALGDAQAAARCRDAAARIAAAVEYRMWNETAGSYAWRIDRLNHASMPSWNRWYPDAVSQLYPVISGLLPPSSARARMLYEKFNRSFPDWPDVEDRPGFPWGIVASAAAAMGDRHRALEFIRSSSRRYVLSGGPRPWYCLESAMYITVVSIVVPPDRRGAPAADDSGMQASSPTDPAPAGTGSPPSLSSRAAPSPPSQYTRRFEAP